MEVTFEDEDLWPVLRGMAPGARQPVEPRSTLHYDIAGRGPYLVWEEGDRLETVTRPSDAAALVEHRCRARLIDHLSLGGWVGAHGGVARLTGRRALFLAEAGSGLTTLLLRLLAEGHAVEGDELVFFRGGNAVCIPHPFMVRPGTRALVPELAAALDCSPTILGGDGCPLVAFAPAEWSLEVGAVDAAFVLRRDPDGEATCRPISTMDLIHAVGPSTLGSPSPAQVLRAISALAARADGYELRAGGVADTAALVAETVSGR